MAIVTVSRGCYTLGKYVAERTAEKLGYECLSREGILETSEQFNIPEIKLVRERADILDQTIFRKGKYISYIRAALLRHLRKDNMVYHGFAGHIFVKDIPRALKVRIIADLEDRVKIVMQRDRVTRNEAVLFVKTIDDQRRKWGHRLYGIDISDSSLYDLVINLSKFTGDEAVDIICQTVGLERFQSTPESQEVMDRLLIEAKTDAKKVLCQEAEHICAIAGVMGV